MKRIFRTIVVAAMAVVILVFTGCNKEENNSNENTSTVHYTPGNTGDNPTPDPGPNPQPNPEPVPDGWVDLGLPSGLLWAECNVGAMAPEQDGYYYSWGEIMPKDYYDWYHYAYGDEHQLTKYCDNPAYGLHGFFDTLTILEPDDDAATANMGNGARTPTYGDWSELISNTTSEWTTHNGKYGRRFTGSNGSTLFLPAAGVYFFTDLEDAGSSGYYWSSSLYVGHNFPENAYAFGFSYYSQGMDPTKRDLGLPVRAVRAR